MAVIQARSKRKMSGGRYTSTLTRRKHMIGRAPTLTRLGDGKRKTITTKGGGVKTRVMGAPTANLLDQKSGKAANAKIITVVDNLANRYFVRRNIITRGTIIMTEKGKARVTSRPGQDGTVNAVLIE